MFEDFPATFKELVAQVLVCHKFFDKNIALCNYVLLLPTFSWRQKEESMYHQSFTWNGRSDNVMAR
jgi:hypothetical protein